jgi:regulator of protease activity HflC (stomatin/prohibitin superfamily)
MALEFTRSPGDPPRTGQGASGKAHDPVRTWVVGGGIFGFLLMAALVIGPIWWWYWWRIEPGNGEFAVLIRKTGDNLPAGEILATKPGQKGIQLEVLPEGRYFRNPYVWTWQIRPITDIPAGKLGVKSRLYGKTLPPGEILAKGDDQKGFLPDVLSPGKYRINPYAYDVQQVDAIHIKPGAVGVVTNLDGADVLDGAIPVAARNQYLVAAGLKGVGGVVLDPGTYYLNPYRVSVVEVNLQSQRFEMSGNDAISFLTEDGFTVVIEGTIEFNIRRDKVALLTHKVGDMEDIIRKIILPRARGFTRIEGSKKKAKEFIVGETRQEFQNNLDKHLKSNCDEWGVAVNSVLIRNIIPPQEVAQVIRDRELAAQDARKYAQQTDQAKSKAELTRQQMLAEQSQRKVEADTLRLRAEIKANQNKEVLLLNATRELEVARIDSQTAKAQAQSLLLGARAEQDVIIKTNTAEAAVLADKAQAFGGGGEFARYMFYSRLAPRLQSILTDDTPGGLGAPLLPATSAAKPVSPAGKEVAP